MTGKSKVYLATCEFGYNAVLTKLEDGRWSTCSEIKPMDTITVGCMPLKALAAKVLDCLQELPVS